MDEIIKILQEKIEALSEEKISSLRYPAEIDFEVGRKAGLQEALEVARFLITIDTKADNF